MNVAAKLAGFAVLLALVFGGAALAGKTIGPERDDGVAAAKPAGAHGMDGMSDAEGAGGHGHGAMAQQSIRGLAVSDGGLTLELARRTADPRKRFDLAFRVVDRRGQTVRDFDVVHTKRLHFLVARRDLTGFQHLHPEQAEDGSWSVPLTLRDAGSYRVFADFSVHGKPYTLADDIAVDGAVRSQALPAPTRDVEVDGLRVRLTQGASKAGSESRLSFDVTRDGVPVTLEPYLGAKGHLVALRQGDLAFLHVHPDENRLSFMAEFPSAGRYRLFLQFQTAGRVHTAAFTQEVSR